MHKAKSLCVESLTRQEFETVLYKAPVLGVNGSLADLGTVITIVIEERVSYPIEMDTDLMCSSCLKTALHHSHITETLENPVMGNGMFSMISLGENLEPHSIIRITSDITYDGTLIVLYITPDYSHITTLDRMHKELLCKIQLSFLILRHDKQA